ncbi:MAG: hypothetical protein II625_06150 [Bacilli bacterium]|nr:hypothetical protein [Bacilli bacterium]
MTYDDIKKANQLIKPIDIKGKEYSEVCERIKAFRMLYPEGTIKTELISNEDGMCIFKAYVYSTYEAQNHEDGIYYEQKLLGTGTAYEKENSTFINKTSYIENCETSAVGRALAMCGIGIDKSIASAEEVINAVNNQEPTEEEAKAFIFESGKHKGKTIQELYETNKQYLQWWLDNGQSERIKQMIMLVTDLKPTVERPQEELMLIVKLQELVNATNTDYETLKQHYGVESDLDMTKEQLEDAISILEKKHENNGR